MQCSWSKRRWQSCGVFRLLAVRASGLYAATPARSTLMKNDKTLVAQAYPYPNQTAIAIIRRDDHQTFYRYACTNRPARNRCTCVPT